MIQTFGKDTLGVSTITRSRCRRPVRKLVSVTQPAPQGRYGGRSAQERRANRRARLVEAGLEQFGTVGYAMSSVRTVCKLANLSSRQFYEEFTSREDLLVALYDMAIAEAMTAVAVALAAEPDPALATRLRTAVSAQVRFAAGDIRRARVVCVEIVGVSPAIEQHRMATRARWAELLIANVLRPAIESGEIPDRDYQSPVVAYVGAVYGMLQDWCTAPDWQPLDAMIDELTRLGIALIS
jgi:AcrR family transcriptional regulator